MVPNLIIVEQSKSKKIKIIFKFDDYYLKGHILCQYVTSIFLKKNKTDILQSKSCWHTVWLIVTVSWKNEFLIKISKKS